MNLILKAGILAAIPLGLPAIPASAQDHRTGTLIVAHGGDSTWNALVHDLATQVRTGGPVAVSFLMGAGARSARFQDAVVELEQRGAAQIVVVPLLVSSHSGHFEQIRWLAGATDSLDPRMHHHLMEAGIARPAGRSPLRVTPALDGSGQVARILAERALALAERPAEQAVFVVAHGPNSAEDHAAWMRHLRALTDSVRALTGFRDVRAGVVRDDAPPPVRAEAVRGVRDLIELQQLATGREVVVVPLLISRGRITRSTLPADLAGLRIRYAGDPLLPHPAMARWVEGQVSARR